MRGRDLKHIDAASIRAAVFLCAFGRKITPRRAARIDVRYGIRRLERREHAHGPPRQGRIPFAHTQVQRFGFQRLIGRGERSRDRVRAQRFPRGVVIGDQLNARVFRFFHIGREKYLRAARVIEQCVEAFVEQRQPMLHPGMFAACTDGFVERVIIRDRAKARQVIGTKAADGIGIERGLARGQQHDAGF